MAEKPTYEELEKKIQKLEQEKSERKHRDEVFEKHRAALPHSLGDDENITFEDMFSIDDIQRLQDEFSAATGVASIITHTDGTPITAPSNFCRLCKDIIRKTDKGLANCFRSDAVLGRLHPEGPIVQTCMSGGLWDAGAGITVGGRHIANWLIGQVRDETQDEEKMLGYAREIGASEKDAVEAFREVAAMSREQFERVAKVLFTLANQLSATAYQNVQQARFIAERKQAEEAIKRSESMHIKMVDSIRDVIVIVDQDGLNRYKSANVEKLFGWKPEELLGASTWENIHPDDLKSTQEFFGEIMSAPDTAGTTECRYRCKDGSYRWIEFSGTNLSHDQDIRGLLGHYHDITDRKQAEESLKESEKEFRSTLNNLLIGVVVHASDTGILFSNPEATKILGLTYDQMSGKEAIDPAWNFVHENLSVMAVEDYPVSKVLSTKKPISDSVFGIKVPGRKDITWVIVNAIPVLSIPGEVDKVIVNFIDYTDRKQAEEQLRRNESLLNATQQLAKIGGWEVDLEKQITFWTDEVYRIHDLQKDKFTSIDEAVKLNLKCYDPENRPLVIEAFRKCTENGQAYDLELPFTTTKGRRIWIRTIANPVMDGDRVVKVVGNFIDITERKQTEEERRTLEYQLRQAQKMESIGTLAGGIAHDFNNILYPIVGYTEMLLEDIPEGSPLRSNLDDIFAGALRARELVKQILTFSRQDRNEFKLLKIQPIIKEALKLIRSTIPTTININQNISNGCGIINADPTQVHQIVMNLATNAYHAMEDSGGELKINLKEMTLAGQDVVGLDIKPGAYACLTVADTGVGIDKHILDKVFDPFFTTKERGKGTGMGLSVIYGIIKNVGGSIHVKSKPGKGTEFQVYLPVVKSTSRQHELTTKKNIQGGTEQILLVDDENAILKMEKLMLERLGYQIVACDSSLTALEMFSATPDEFDVVITDMAMPNMSGDKLAAELIKLRPDVPILLCTGFSEKIPEENEAVTGIKGVLMKPIIRVDLARKIREVLDD